MKEGTLAAVVSDILLAWKSLPGGKSYQPEVIAKWLMEDMYPSIENARKAIAALEAEKPAEDARSLAIDISLGALDRAEFWEVIVPKQIHSFAESYHKKKCAECKEMKKLYVKFGNETPPDACLSCGRQCPNDCPLDLLPEVHS